MQTNSITRSNLRPTCRAGRTTIEPIFRGSRGDQSGRDHEGDRSDEFLTEQSQLFLISSSELEVYAEICEPDAIAPGALRNASHVVHGPS